MAATAVELDRDAESRLVQRWQAGDAGAFEALYEVYTPRLLATIRRSGWVHETEDLAHDVWVKTSRAISNFDPARPLWPWLSRIARNVVIDHARKTGAHARWHVRDRDHSDVELPTGAAIDLELHDMRLQLEAAMLHLSPKLRSALQAIHLHGYTYSEVSEFLGVTEETVRKRVERALRTVRSSVGSAPQ